MPILVAHFMTDDARVPANRWWFLLPFVLGDLVMLTAATLIYMRAGRPMNAVETAAFSACVCCGALFGVWPFVLRNKAALKAYEINELTTTLSQIQRSEEVAQCIANATGQWHAVHEQAATTLAAAREIAESMANTQKEFRALFDRAADTERNNLRLEVNKLRRAEADWLHVLVRIMDHVYALYAAGVRSGQRALIEQFANFQNACRDAARRIGLVPVLAAPGETFNPEIHQLMNPNDPVPGNAIVAEMLATGYAYQGQLIRRVLVVLQAAQAAGPARTDVIESFSSSAVTERQTSEAVRGPTDVGDAAQDGADKETAAGDQQGTITSAPPTQGPETPHTDNENPQPGAAESE